MSEQKPKIDLKARLGKKPVSTAAVGGSSIPPPMASSPSGAPGGMARPAPRTSAPPQQHQLTPSGVPVPPFGSRPAVDPSNPYGAGQPQAAPARPQAIRIEMGEEVMAARRAGRKKVLFLALVTFGVGGFVGFTAGGGAERAKGAEAAITGAQDLVKEINTANGEVQKLADTLKSAKEKLGKNQFPDDEVSKLGSINIPFGGKNLAGKGIGRFKPEIVAMLIEYAGSASDANAQKEKLQNVLAGTKKGIQELLQQQGDKAVIRWGVVMTSGPNGPLASMAMLPAPVGIKDKWPDEIKVGSGQQAQTLKRYNSGNPVNNDNPLFVPVDPGTQSAVCPSDVVFKLRRELNDLESVLRGDNTPGEERTGLMDSARQLTEKLKKIGQDTA